MKISARSPRRQRRARYLADTFERRRRMTVPLSRELRTRFGRRAASIRKGDTVRVLGGSFVGREERVARVDRRGYSVTLDNVTVKTADEKLKALPIQTSHLVITRLNLSDAWRRRALKVREEDVTAEERGEAPEGEGEAGGAPAPAAEEPATPPPAVEEAKPTEAEPEEKTTPEEPTPAAGETGSGEAEEQPTPRPRRRRSTAKSPPPEEEP